MFKVLKIIVLTTIFVVRISADFNFPATVATPFGPMRTNCVHSAPNGAFITELADGVDIIHPDGTIKHYAQCAHSIAPLQPIGLTIDDDYYVADGWVDCKKKLQRILMLL